MSSLNNARVGDTVFVQNRDGMLHGLVYGYYPLAKTTVSDIRKIPNYRGETTTMLFLEVQGGPKFFMPRMIQWYSGGIAAGTPELEAAFAEQQLILGGIAVYKRAMPNQLHRKENGDYSHGTD